MRVILFIGLLFFISYGAGGSQGPFFWTAEKDGKTHHILGTMHVNLNFEDLQCFETIKARLKKSQILFTELNINNFAVDLQENRSQDIQTREESALWKSLKESEKEFVLKKMVELNKAVDPSLETYYSTEEELEASFKEILKKLSREEILGTLQLSCKSAEAKSSDKKLQETLDNKVFQFATEHSINRMPLETVEDVYPLFKSLLKIIEEFLLSLDESIYQESISKAAKDFDGFCSDISKAKELVERLQTDMIMKYKSGALDISFYLDSTFELIFSQLTQYNISNSAKESFKKDVSNIVSEKLLKERNEKWLPKILSAHNSYNNIFVATGAGHFIGEYDVLNLLKKEGFVIKRFSSECQ